MLKFIRQRISLKYFSVVILTIGTVFSGMFFWVSGMQKKLIMEQVEKQAVILHKQIVLTRQWVSDHNYVLVARKEDDTANAFIRDPEIADTNGTVYTRITPAGLTRRLSGYAAKDHLYSFNLTNTETLNPDNRPDPFETEAIRLFRSGKADSLTQTVAVEGKPVFRYAAPLRIRESCLACHNQGDLSVGDVGGCISVFIPFEEAQKAIQRDNMFLLTAMLLLTLTVILVLLFTTQRIILRPVKKIREFTRNIRSEALAGRPLMGGDELREFADLCYVIDEKLRGQHKELEARIAEATADLQRTNLELTALNQAKVDFFTDISHEMRTPLTAIKGAADILARKASCSDPIYVEIIKKQTDHLIETIVDFLDFAKFEAGQLSLELSREHVADIVQEATVSMQPVADKKGVRLVVEANADPVAMVDGHRIFQVMTNLLSNAVRHSPEQGTVTVGVDSVNGCAEIWVADQGPGIPEPYREIIFKKFHKIPKSGGTQTPYRGSSGIGLAICRQLVEAHEGKIGVGRQAGGGSRFVFTVPLVTS